MIGKLVEIRRYCKEHTKIENYELAVSDHVNKWECHHRMEIDEDGHRRSRKELIAMGEYFNVSPDKLIFMKQEEHWALHRKGVTIKKLSDKFTGEGNPFYGHHHSAETIEKIKAYVCTDSLREKRRKNATGRKIIIGADGKRHWSPRVDTI